MRKHTTIDLDAQLVRDAGAILGTHRITDTIHAALEDVVRRDRRLSLLDLGTELDLKGLDEIRSHRFAERPASYDAPKRPTRRSPRRSG